MQSDIATYIMESYKGSIRQRGQDCFDISVYFPPKRNVIRIAYNKRGERIRSKTEAMEVLIEVNHGIKDKTFEPALYQKVSRLRFDNAIKGWFEKNKASYSPKSRKDYCNRINNILIPEFGSEDIRDVTSWRIDDLHHKLLKVRGSKTVTNIMSILKAFFRDMRIHGITPPIFPLDRNHIEKQRGWCEFEPFMEVVNEIPSQMDREFVVTTRLEWLRPGETRALMWKDFDFENDVLTVQRAFSLNELKSTKNKKPVLKPLHPQVKNILQERRGLPEAFVFTKNGIPYSESWVRKVWNLAARKKSLKIGLYEATRHSAASEAASDHQSIYVIKELLGHDNVKSTERYAKVDMKAKRRVMEAKQKVVEFKKEKQS